jgi:hypothetical protein
MSGIDYQSAARLMLQKHGANAQARARQRATKLLAEGDPDGYLRWTRVHDAIDELRFGATGAGTDLRVFSAAS